MVFSLAIGSNNCLCGDEITYFPFFFLTENTAIFMCKCCNLFSPNQSELLSHVSEKHMEEGVNVDEIIIPLRPLSTPEPPSSSKTGDGKGTGGRGRIPSDTPVDVDLLLGHSRSLDNPHFQTRSHKKCPIVDTLK